MSERSEALAGMPNLLTSVLYSISDTTSPGANDEDNRFVDDAIIELLSR